MSYRFSTSTDIPLLVGMNQQLIRDEGHLSQLTRDSLQARMTAWLDEGYSAVVFEENSRVIGYALFRQESNYVYLRQFYVEAGSRRRGAGRSAIRWLTTNAWKSATHVRLDALIGNTTAIAFWHSLGFQDYCLTMEQVLVGNGEPH